MFTLRTKEQSIYIIGNFNLSDHAVARPQNSTRVSASFELDHGPLSLLYWAAMLPYSSWLFLLLLLLGYHMQR